MDKVRSAIILDIIRSAPVLPKDREDFIMKGWTTEIKLIDTLKYPTCNFYSFFHAHSSQPIHPLLPYNPKSASLINKIFVKFRDSLIAYPRIHFPRYTHKNMSRSTRRDFEETFKTSIDDIPIFGQDDWIRVYHEYGIFLEGDVESRQKWYPSGAKPRTYFAMGGTTYQNSRHLQDFFTDVVDLFEPTNHVTRLRPERLRVSAEDECYLIYDLSSFTSNMTEQRSFMESLAEFFVGVPFTVMDEAYGPVTRDLGEMLKEYNHHCVNHPVVSLERVPESIRPFERAEHGAASMLGIFGNLMMCTLAHFLILSTLVDEFNRINIAGDDGLVPLLPGFDDRIVSNAISIVGDFAPEKTMKTTDEGAVHLKRPIAQYSPYLFLGPNFVPPNVATAVAFLTGEDVDARYQHMGIEEMTLGERVSVVGKDLSRFLRSVYQQRHAVEIDFDDVLRVFRGFCGLVESILGFYPSAQMWSPRKLNYMWPVDPSTYDFYESDPLMVYCYVSCAEVITLPVVDTVPVDWSELREIGDEHYCNSSPSLKLLETLGYVEREDVQIHLSGNEAVRALFSKLSAIRLPPIMYKFSVVNKIPDHFCL
jgi:hypothetical protein